MEDVASHIEAVRANIEDTISHVDNTLHIIEDAADDTSHVQH